VAERDRSRFARLGERPSLEQHRRFGYRPQLDGVRAIAILPVVTYHAWVVPRGGFLGVDIFFVLSGFLITTLLVEEAQASGRISLPHFYFRRALRLLPALFVAALGYVLLSSLEVAVSGHTHAGTPLGDVFKGAAYGVLYVQNILIATGTAMPLAVGHLWSLATEEQFYLLWPLALVIALRLGLSRRTLTILLVAAVAALNIDRIDLMLGSASFQRVYFAPDGHFDVILIGCLAGLAFTGGSAERLLARPARVLALGGLAVVGLMLALPEFAHWHVVLGLLPVLAIGIALMILAVVVDGRSPVSRCSRCRRSCSSGRSPTRSTSGTRSCSGRSTGCRRSSRSASPSSRRRSPTTSSSCRSCAGSAATGSRSTRRRGRRSHESRRTRPRAERVWRPRLGRYTFCS
jgi:peptidoglycan/LPS O-acetylase OafA/YrhL